MSTTSVGNEFVKPLVSAVIGAAISAFVTVSHMQTSIAVLEAKVQRMEKVSEKIEDLAKELSYMRGQRYGKDM